ncbi:TetR/AcrR family transcriptional regulator [Mesobaculum littorinae]|uniref:TetR/AcrR family transcriptional regulator n=1 Tax=Mesobaculum littorinae TaxID=2486419 RepID=A0A438AGX1_9RHOB|nr:TetR/AcrR family transcriptional regulator [Mesobaculum littorinae]RVV97817.1 TetR/AcrR family transcriptional regulator [Mesobaculum littorinae]
MNAETGTIRKGRKFQQVLQGARDVFMRDGYSGACVDEIAKAAGVSKATLYSYFPDKRMIFSEVARYECTQQAQDTLSEIDLQAPPREVLARTGRHLICFILSEFGQRVFRISVAESDRFPELGRRFYESGPGMVEVSMCTYFDLAIQRGELSIPDKRLAAHQFAELCKADIFPRVLFGIQTEFTEAEIDRVVSSAVDMFLSRYGTESART